MCAPGGEGGAAEQRQGNNTASNSGPDKSRFKFWMFLCSSASLKTLENREQVSLCLLWRQTSAGRKKGGFGLQTSRCNSESTQRTISASLAPLDSNWKGKPSTPELFSEMLIQLPITTVAMETGRPASQTEIILRPEPD